MRSSSSTVLGGLSDQNHDSPVHRVSAPSPPSIAKSSRSSATDRRRISAAAATSSSASAAQPQVAGHQPPSRFATSPTVSTQTAAVTQSGNVAASDAAPLARMLTSESGVEVDRASVSSPPAKVDRA